MNVATMNIDEYAAHNKIKKSFITTVSDLKAKAAAGKQSSGFIALSDDDFSDLNPTELAMLGWPSSSDELCIFVTVKNGTYKQFVNRGRPVPRFTNNVRSI